MGHHTVSPLKRLKLTNKRDGRTAGDAVVRLLLREGTADWDGAGVGIQEEETLTSGER